MSIGEFIRLLEQYDSETIVKQLICNNEKSICIEEDITELTFKVKSNILTIG